MVTIKCELKYDHADRTRHMCRVAAPYLGHLLSPVCNPESFVLDVETRFNNTSYA